MRCRSRRTVEAYFRDGTPEADSAIIQAVDGAELLTDALGVAHLRIPTGFGGSNLRVGWWMYKEFSWWSTDRDEVFRRKFEVPNQ